MLSAWVGDMVEATQAALRSHAPADAQALRLLPPLARFSEPVRADTLQLKRFLFSHLYRHPQVEETTQRARTVVTELFEAYRSRPA